MTFIDETLLDLQLKEMTAKDRIVRLYDVNGQTLFPVFSPTGALSANVACYLMLRGENRVLGPDGDFPTVDGGIKEFENGWIAMCIIFSYQLTTHEKIAKLKEAERKLLATRKPWESGGTNAT